jgi:hypothetical protein
VEDGKRGVTANLEEAAALTRAANIIAEAFEHARGATSVWKRTWASLT